MEYKTLSGKEPASAILTDLKKRIEALGRKPRLAIVVVGSYKPTQVYVERKQKTSADIGIDAEVHRLPENAEEAELLALVEKLNKDEKVNGFIVQTPLPKHINVNRIFEKINPEKDVDGFHPSNMGKILLHIFDEKMFKPATPAGIMELLDYYDVRLEGKHAVVIGRSNIVGKPVAMLLLHRNATVTLCHTKTTGLKKHTLSADILISAAGNPGLLKSDMIKEGASVIDVGTTRIIRGGKEAVVGDVDFENVIKKAHCSPVPGGVGPMTVAMLLKNTVIATERQTTRTV